LAQVEKTNEWWKEPKDNDGQNWHVNMEEKKVVVIWKWGVLH
jgi:hypothetical protein